MLKKVVCEIFSKWAQTCNKTKKKYEQFWKPAN